MLAEQTSLCMDRGIDVSLFELRALRTTDLANCGTIPELGVL